MNGIRVNGVATNGSKQVMTVKIVEVDLPLRDVLVLVFRVMLSITIVGGIFGLIGWMFIGVITAIF